MALTINTRTGPVTNQDGPGDQAIRQGRTAELVVTDAHGRFQEACARGGLFSRRMTLSSISNATISTGTLGATATPIVGVWNPLGTGKNVVILQVRVAPVNT